MPTEVGFRQSGKPAGSKSIGPSAPDLAGIDARMKQSKFVYWTVKGEKKSAKGNTSGRIQFDPPLKTLAQAVGGLDDFTRAGARARMDQEAEIITQEMREQAPWEDRGGTARESLVAFVRESKNLLSLVAGYDKDYLLTFQRRDRVNGTFPREYDIFLETMQGGKFAIVGPTLEERYASFMGLFVNMWQEGAAINKGFQKRRTEQAATALRRAQFASLKGGK